MKYDPARIGYAQLLDVFWRNIDPLAVDRQFCDAGDQYHSAIFPFGAKQQRLAEASKRVLQDSGRFDRPIATQIVAASRFYRAERDHQDYYKKNPVRYKFYRFTCGRDQRLEATGRIEVTDTTFWFGFKDDVVIRVEADGTGSRIDVRSVSRVGKSDVGTNARRIRGYLQALDAQ